MALPESLPVLVVVVVAFLLATTAVGLGIGFGLERLWRRPVWALPVPAGQYGHELRGNVVFVVVVGAGLSALLASGLVRFGDETLLRIALTFGALYLGFQAWFYALHRTLHLRGLVRFHRYHHESRVTTPLSGQSMGPVEAVGWTLGYTAMPLLFSFVAPISAYGLIGYLAFNLVGNIVGHANVEVVPPSKTLWLRSLLATVFTYHALHHARWTGHYGFASTWADRLFRTEWADWPALHERVWSRQPLQSLKDRADPPELETIKG